MSQKKFIVLKFWKSTKTKLKIGKKNNIVSSKIKFWKIEQQLKVEKEDEREAPW